MKWFSMSGITTEVKRIRWPKSDEMLKNTMTVISVVVLFGIYFVIAQLIVTFFLQLIGV